ncbi:hypothetical protein JA1_005431, partial [Spathaspora sp. JA1]
TKTAEVIVSTDDQGIRYTATSDSVFTKYTTTYYDNAADTKSAEVIVSTNDQGSLYTETIYVESTLSTSVKKDDENSYSTDEITGGARDEGVGLSSKASGKASNSATKETEEGENRSIEYFVSIENDESVKRTSTQFKLTADPTKYFEENHELSAVGNSNAGESEVSWYGTTSPTVSIEGDDDRRFAEFPNSSSPIRIYLRAHLEMYRCTIPITGMLPHLNGVSLFAQNIDINQIQEDENTPKSELGI